MLVDSRNKKSESEDEDSSNKNEVKEKPADVEKKNEEKIVSEEESIEDISSDSIEEDSKDE